MKYKYSDNRQQGVVSLFVVIFTALLITIVTVSFVQIMLRTQQEASIVDLSQSAYDSALAGVEDAKRAILVAEQKNSANNALNSNACDSVAVALGEGNGKETLVQQNTGNGGDELLDQAYTCVKVQRDTADVRDDNLSDASSQLIPLSGVNQFSKVRISWKLHQDPSSTDVRVPTLRTDPTQLTRAADWGIDTPALVRAQLMQFGGSFNLSDFDTSDSGTASKNSRTQFLYPIDDLGDTSASNSNTMSSFPNATAPSPVNCSATNDYSCSITISLPNPENGDASSRKAYLRLNALYNTADYKVELLDSANRVVKFSGVQAQVDSTGRAGDVFRRVEAVVNLKITSFPYPEAAVDLRANLCKTFRVTDKSSDYDAGACKPYDTNN